MASKTASKAFSDKTKTIRKQLDHVRDLFDMHVDSMPSEVNDWGQVGDLGRIEESLKEALAVLLNCDPSRVGDCPVCGIAMECGDEDIDERRCDACAQLDPEELEDARLEHAADELEELRS